MKLKGEREKLKVGNQLVGLDPIPFVAAGSHWLGESGSNKNAGG